MDSRESFVVGLVAASPGDAVDLKSEIRFGLDIALARRRRSLARFPLFLTAAFHPLVWSERLLLLPFQSITFVKLPLME